MMITERKQQMRVKRTYYRYGEGVFAWLQPVRACFSPVTYVGGVL